MKNILYLIILILLIITTQEICQTQYEVVPGTKNNRVILNIVNLTGEGITEAIEVNILHNSNFIKLGSNSKTFTYEGTTNESEVEFIFDIERDAKINSKDTLNVLIRTNLGVLASKEIILTYLPPESYKLEQNYPNPFNPLTTIRFQLPEDGKVNLIVYDILGREVTVLLNKDMEAGYHETQFNAGNLASGMYIYRITTKNFNDVKKMMVVK